MRYYWKQTDWNEYTLVPPHGVPVVFGSYESLWHYCKAHNIDAAQV
jgi:hypothetical protein